MVIHPRGFLFTRSADLLDFTHPRRNTKQTCFNILRLLPQSAQEHVNSCVLCEQFKVSNTNSGEVVFIFHLHY